MSKKNIIFLVFSSVLVISIIFSIVIGERRQRQLEEKAIALQNDKNKEENSNSKEVENSKDKEQVTEPVKEVPKDPFEGLPLKGNEIGVPVLYYHSVEDGSNNELVISKQKFREHMKFIKDNGFTTLTMNDLYEYIKNNKKVPEKSVVITFDDGYADNYRNAYPILKEFGLKATIYVVTDWIDKDGYYMTSTQLKELDKNGIEIQSHTGAHDHLATLTKEKQLDTLKRSKEKLEKILGREVGFIAYPYGEYDDRVMKSAQEAGYKMGLSTNKGWSSKTNNLYSVNRIYISAFITMDNFKQRLTNSKYQ